MKKSYVGILICLLCLAVLSGCCSHQWQEATCDTPKTCASCAETEGEALGHNWQEASCASPKHCETCGLTEGTALEHSWQEASCETPKTCTLCGSTEGEALGHSFTDWGFDEETMHRTCETCALEEKQAIDREMYLRQQLEGYWACPDISHIKVSPHLNYREDSISFFDCVNSTSCELHFSGYDAELDCYNAVLVTTEGDEHLLCYAPGEEVPLTLTLADKQELSLMKNEYLDLVTGRTWAGYCADTLYLVNFNPDGTVTGTIGTPTEESPGDSVTGAWFAGVMDEVSGYFFPLHVSLSGAELPARYPKVDLYSYLNDTIRQEYRHLSIALEKDNTPFSLVPISEDMVNVWLTAAREAETALVGNWQSETLLNMNQNQILPKFDYTITFQENGTLTANLDYPISGSWKPLRMEVGDPAYAPRTVYQISLPPYDHLQINQGHVELFSHQTNTKLTFWRAEDRDAVRNQVAGNWVSTCYTYSPRSDPSQEKSEDMGGYHLTLTRDGQISGNIGRKIQTLYGFSCNDDGSWTIYIPLEESTHGYAWISLGEDGNLTLTYFDEQTNHSYKFTRE